MKKLTARAYAKLNLYLDITGRRADGYHLLETVMQSISLHDVVSVELNSGEGITLRCDREDVPTDRRNTAYKAAELFLREAGMSARVDIAIEKHIPGGAGMGGGSADAAAVLRMLNRAAGFPLEEEKLLDISVLVGADVPFCLVGGTKLCRGIGEQLSEFTGLVVPEDMQCVVVKPEFSCPTGEAYKRYDEAPLPSHGGLELFRNNFPAGMYNVFQTLYSDERIETLCSRITELGAEGAMLTGSGSAVFGVFRDAEKASAARDAFPGCFAEQCAAVAEGVTITEEQEGSYDKGSE